MKKILSAALLASWSVNGFSQTTLTPGDAAVIGFNTDDPDQIFWVNLVDIAAGTQIKFTDNGWNGTALTTSEGTVTWTAAAAVPRGTVQSLAITGIALGTTGDQVFVYQGAATAPAFIYGLSTNNWVTGSISQATSRRPATLTSGTNALAFSTERDNGFFNIISNTGDKTSFLTAIANSANWTRSDTRYASFPAWVFTFAGMSAEPAASPTNLVFSSLKSYQYSLSFSAISPAPTGYLVVRAIGGLPNTDPTDGVVYTQGSTLGNGVVLSSSTALSFTDKSVVANTSYGIKVYAYQGNGTLRNYRQTAPLSGTVTTNANEMGTYYQTVSPANSTFVTDLQNRIRTPYTKVSYDLYDETMLTNFAFGYAPNNQRTVTCVYSGQLYAYTPPFVWYTASPFSREHTWCVSWMPSGGGTSLNEYADQHHLFPVNQNSANGVRSNHPLGIVQTVTSSYLEGKYGLDASGNTVYEPRNAQKGDAARALLYMSLRYNGINGFNWTFDHLNNVILPGLSEDPQSLSLLLSWHNQDLPDNFEISRNDYIQSIQQNRNPFIDYPQWVNNINFGNLSYVSPSASATQSQTEQKSNDVLDALDLRCYPNPARDVWNVGWRAAKEQITQITWVDASGRIAASHHLATHAGDNQWQLSVDDLKAGIYTVVIQSEQINTTLRMVVE